MPTQNLTATRRTARHISSALVVILGLLLLVLAARAGLPLLLLAALLLLALLGRHWLGQRDQREAAARIAELEALYQRSSQLADHLSLMNHAVQTIMSRLDPADAWQRVCQASHQVGGADAAVVYLLEPPGNRGRYAHACGLTPGQQTQYAALTPLFERPLEQPLRVHRGESDAEADRLMQPGAYQTAQLIPLRSNNTTLGVLALLYKRKHTPDSMLLELLEMLASQVATIIDNTDLFAAMEVYTYEMAQLAHLSRISTSNLDLDRMSADVAQILGQILQVNQVVIALIDAADHMHLHAIGRHASDPAIDSALQQTDTLQFPELDDLLQRGVFSLQTFHAGAKSHSQPLDHLLREWGAASLAVVPVAMGDALIGVIVLGSQQPRQFDGRERHLLETATNQLATHIQNARLYTATRLALSQRLDQLSIIERIARQISSSLDFEQIIDHILAAATSSTQADSVAFAMLTEAGHIRLTCQPAGVEALDRLTTSLPRDTGVIGQVLRTGQSVIIDDNRRFPDYVALPNQPDYRSSLAVPLRQDQAVIGALLVESRHERYFHAEHSRFLENLADHAVISIANARLLAEQRYQVSVLTHLQALADRLSTVSDPHASAEAILETTLDLFEGHEAALFRFDRDSDRISLIASRRFDADFPSIAQSVLVEQVAREAAQTGETQIDRDIRHIGNGGVTVTYTSVLSVPLVRDRRTHEVLCIAYTHPRNFTRRDLYTLSLLASQAAGHMENARLNETIRTGNHRMSTILHSTRDGVILLDQRGGLIQANPAAYRLLGATLDAYITEAVKQQAQQPARTEPVTRRRFRHEHNNQAHYIEEIGTPVVEAGQRSAGYLFVLRDITEEKLLEDYRDEITHMVIHDLRGPLASIISSMNLVIDVLHHEVNTDIIEQTTRLAADSANTLMNLVESLLDIAKLEARSMPLKPRVVGLSEPINGALDLLNSTIQEMDITIHYDLPADLTPVYIDTTLIQRVFTNLLDNALTHTPIGGDIHISASLQPDHDRIEVRIADSGPGIPVEEHERIFEKFRQIKNPNQEHRKRGTGLGLTFCKLAVEAHDGHIWIANSCDLPGACIAFTLPVASEQSKVTHHA